MEILADAGMLRSRGPRCSQPPLTCKGVVPSKVLLRNLPSPKMARSFRVLVVVSVLLGLAACDSGRWQHAKCLSEADAAVRAVSALERRRECNSPAQCAAVERERVEVNEARREAQLFACMRSQGFEFDAERWTRDRQGQRELSGHRYWSRDP
jgi:hypothetical protein